MCGAGLPHSAFIWDGEGMGDLAWRRRGHGQAMERAHHNVPEVARAAQRLGVPRVRNALVAKRLFDASLALVMLVALLPVAALMTVLLLTDEHGWLERRERVGRNGELLRLARFRPPPSRLGRALERVGARELPLLMAVLGGRLSFVGPRALEPGVAVDGPRRLMAPGLTGPAQRWAKNDHTAAELDDAYVEEWSLLGDVKLLTGRPRGRRLAAHR
jgi:lipopolysaccharide/colanic/teichoic acid biosynthesis glycosyltransferase